MKRNRFVSEQLKRASEVITYDRLGVSSSMQGILSKHLTDVLGEYFCLSEGVKTKIVATKKGFLISITATAKSVKELKTIV